MTLEGASMRILVTGASGLLGINLALEASKQHEVIGLTNSNHLCTDRFQVLRGDLLDPGAVQRLLVQTQPDWVIHCAALADLDACEADPARASQLNSEIPRQLAEHVARGGARLLHVSTDAVFDGLQGNYREEDRPNPLGVYARSKLEGEQAVARADPSAIIARVNLFGFSLGGRRSLGEFFLNNLKSGRRVLGFTDVFFCPLLANDLALIFLRMLELQLSGLYHVVSSDCITKYEFGVRLAHRFELDEDLIQPASWKQSSLKAARSPVLTLSTGKLAQALGKQLPDQTAELDGFYNLYQQGYPEMIRQMKSSD
jgi:dTDP-4-dehydrorhamnose reductase